MKYKIMLVLLVLLVPTIVNALGLGRIELQSALSQPFKARIELLSATIEELDSLKVSLANQEAFDRADIPRAFLLTHLRFKIQEYENGSNYIQIHSSELIREPFLDFLLEVQWSKGRLFREYTVLLDPPTYTASSSRKKTSISSKTPVITDADGHQIFYDPEPKITYAGDGYYGPIVTGDTLWSIAKKISSHSSISIQQMMLAILNTNPDAFIENNINGLKRGFILQIPDSSEINFLDQTNILTQVNKQHALWEEYKAHVSTHVSQQVESVSPYSQISEEMEETESDTQEVPIPEVEETGKAELRLISESGEDSENEQSSTVSGGVEANALNHELVLTNESIEALFLENSEIKDKLVETEGIVDDLKRLIVLKEDEFAVMQEQIMIAAVEAEKDPFEEIEAVAEEKLLAEEPVEEIEVVAEEELLAEEPVEETEAVAEEELLAEEPVEETETVAEEKPLAETKKVIVADDQAMAGSPSWKERGIGILEKTKAHLVLIGSVIGGLLLLVFLVIFILKKRTEKAEIIELLEEDDFDAKATMDYSESEAKTVIPDNDAEEIEEEASQTSAPEIPEEDIMEEINVFIAYEHFDEAESFVKKALKEDPDNINLHDKLLDIFYASGNKKAYENAAKIIHEKTGGQGEYWERAMLMWQEMSPNRALFATPILGEEEEVSTGSGGILNIAMDDDGSTDATEMDFNIGGEKSVEDLLEITPVAGNKANEDLLEITPVVKDKKNEDLLEITPVVKDKKDEDLLEITPVAEGKENEELLSVTSIIDFDPKESTEDLLDMSSSNGGAENISDVSMDTDSEKPSELDILPEHTVSDNTDLLDDSTDMEVSNNADDLDISFAEEDNTVLDISMDIDSEGSSELDILPEHTIGDNASLLDDSADMEVSDNADDLDISFAEEDNTVLDISMDIDSEEPSELDILPEHTVGDNTSLLDDSTDMEVSDNADDLDVSFTDTPTNAGDETALDTVIETDSKDPNEFDISFENSVASSSDLLDDSSDMEISDSSDELDISFTDTPDAGGETELDALNESEDVEEFSLNLNEELSMDKPADLDVDMDISEPELDDSVIDMDSTVQMSPASLDALGLSDDNDNDNTHFIPKSSGADEQSEDEEMASQLDLAKAYIELGDTENAETILNEIIVQGGDIYRQQAEDLLGQIN